MSDSQAQWSWSLSLLITPHLCLPLLVARHPRVAFLSLEICCVATRGRGARNTRRGHGV